MNGESGVATCSNEIYDLPSNEDALSILNVLDSNDSCTDIPDTNSNTNNSMFRKNELCVTVWQEDGKENWYLGYFISENDDGTYVIKHLHRVTLGCDLYWMHPGIEDIAKNIRDIDIFPIIPIGDWEISNTRLMRFKLKNCADISKSFKKYIEQ